MKSLDNVDPEEVDDDGDEALHFEEDVQKCKLDHSKYVDYIPYTNSSGYFKAAYLEKNPYWPSACKKCKKKLVDKSKDKIDADNEYKVSAKNMVYMCPCAQDVRYDCVHAYCAPCMIALKTKLTAV